MRAWSARFLALLVNGQGLFCRTNRVFHEHGDGHGANATGHGTTIQRLRSPQGQRPRRGATPFSGRIVDSINAHVNHNGPGLIQSLSPCPVAQRRPPPRRLLCRRPRIMGAGVNHGNGGVRTLRSQQQSGRHANNS